jgi:poly(hydroxyalkanoate) depolymerase family esterase
MTRIRLRDLLLRVCLAMGVVCAAAPQLSHAGSYVYDNEIVLLGGRNHQLWIPTGYTPGEPVPLIVALHGCSQTPLDFAGLTRLSQLADTEKFIVIYPMQSLLANLLSCWNWMYSTNQTRGEGEPAFIMDIVSQVRASYTIDASRIYVVGASAGGVMTSILMACYSDVFAAGMVASGGMYKAADNTVDSLFVGANGSRHSPQTRGREAWQCSGSAVRRPVPVLFFHGSADNVAAPVNGEQALQQFIQTNDFGDDGADNDTVRNSPTSTSAGIAPGGLSFAVRDYVYNGQHLLEHYLVEGMAHAWSGGDPDFSFAEPDGPNATAIMWAFFKEHRR